MNILILTNEYPPYVYGGAGVHVDHLVRALEESGGSVRHRLQVLCFGDQRVTEGRRSVIGIGPAEEPGAEDAGRAKVLDPLRRNIAMAGMARAADIVHCHTWYTYLAGCLLKQLLQVPLVVTTHSLEPHRPWKRQQLGNGYDATAWLEKTALENADAIIAVSGAMQADVRQLYDVPPGRVNVIPNGIDTRYFRETRDETILDEYGIDRTQPFVLFVGRETPQKGIVHLIRAFGEVKAPVQLVLCSGAADTPADARAVMAAVQAVGARTRNPVIRIREMVPLHRLRVLYSHASVFVCPSVYEPFGIINLEAMACKTPVVASAVGGIPEVVVDGETGLLVPFEPVGAGDAEPADPQRFARDLAAAIDALMADPDKRLTMSTAARRHVEANFDWQSIGRQTLAVYDRALAHSEQ